MQDRSTTNIVQSIIGSSLRNHLLLCILYTCRFVGMAHPSPHTGPQLKARGQKAVFSGLRRLEPVVGGHPPGGSRRLPKVHLPQRSRQPRQVDQSRRVECGPPSQLPRGDHAVGWALRVCILLLQGLGLSHRRFTALCRLPTDQGLGDPDTGTPEHETMEGQSPVSRLPPADTKAHSFPLLALIETYDLVTRNTS